MPWRRARSQTPKPPSGGAVGGGTHESKVELLRVVLTQPGGCAALRTLLDEDAGLRLALATGRDPGPLKDVSAGALKERRPGMPAAPTKSEL